MSVELNDLALWAYIIMLGILLGGALFERLVLVHVWASAPPDSVRAWNGNPQYALDPPRRFFMFVTLPLCVLAPLNLYLAWSGAAAGRSLLLFSTGAVLVVIVVTFTYFAPVLRALTERRGEGLEDATIIRMTWQWVALQYVRLALVAVAWLAALYAFHTRA